MTDRDPDALHHLRHSTAHVLAQAVLEMWPGATFAGGPAIDNGFYYDFELPGGATFTDDDLERIDSKMREIIAADQPFERFELPVDEAKELMADHPYKRAFMDLAAAGDDADGEAGAGTTISFYRNTPEFVDMCLGPHVPCTGRLGHFKLMRHGGAYFRGQREEPDAPAHLRHGVGHEVGPRRTTCSCWSRPKPATTAASVPSSTCSRSPRRSAAVSRSSIRRAGSSDA